MTKNKINGRYYIGQHKGAYDKSYFGSGKLIQQAISKYGIESFSNEVLCYAESKEELNELEKRFISGARIYDLNGLCYNIASGGDGGDTTLYMSSDEKASFVARMTAINRERCSSQEFREAARRRMAERYSSDQERYKQAEKVHRYWNADGVREAHGQKIRNYWETHKRENQYLAHPCVFELGETRIEFKYQKDLLDYLSTEYGYRPRRDSLRKLLEQGRQRIPFNPFHKHKFNKLIGMMIYRKDEGVETMGDECSPVEHEIGTCSKCKTETEEIVQSA